MKQKIKGRAFFVESTEKGNFAVIEVEDIPDDSIKVYQYPANILKEADVVVFPKLKLAQNDMLVRVKKLLPDRNVEKTKKLRTN